MTNNSLPLRIENLTFRYRTRSTAAIHDISLELHAGEILLVAGASGCGKTTLMRCVNGLIPDTYSGEMAGRVEIFGQDVQGMSMNEISNHVGTLLQDPERQIVGSYVLNEVAFGLENLGMPRGEIIQRVDETLDYLGILHLKERETFQISGGEKQKVALAGVLVMRPQALLLDEPLASLDPLSSQETLHLFRRLADDGIAIMLVEHRVEDALTIRPDRALYMEDGASRYYGDVDGMLEAVNYRQVKLPARVAMQRARSDPQPEFKPALPTRDPEDPLVSFEDVSFRYAPDLEDVLQGIHFKIYPGEVIGILGPNGAGKTTLVKHTLGLLKPTKGRVLLQGKDTRQATVAQLAHTVGYVFQSPAQMLFAPSVREELAFGPKNLKHEPSQIKKDVQWAIETVNLAAELDTPPLALSFGQQKRVSIASVLAMRSRILMMDEPTAGQDYWNYIAFMDSILQMPGFDAVLFITHDVDLAVIYASRVLLLSEGRLMADGPTQEVMADEDLLRSCKALPTSLLKLNLEYLPQTGRFLRAEALAHAIGK